MPLQINLVENELIGPMLREAELRGELILIRRLLEKRFGALPPSAEEAPDEAVGGFTPADSSGSGLPSLT
jgi:hypothetical protein